MSYSTTSPSQSERPLPSPYTYAAATPPPPPPKPGPSGPGTPLRGPPLPPPPPSHAAHNNHHNYQQAEGAQLAARPPLAGPESGWLPELLQDKATQDLHHLLEDPELQAALLNNAETSHPSIQASQGPLRQLLESNVALATDLQQLEARLTDQRSATQSRLLSLKALEQQHRTRITETENTLRGFSPMALYQRLSASVQEQDALVKGIEESFLDQGGLASDREIADFIRRVRDAKRTSFLRQERRERWDEGRVGGWR